MGLRAPKKEAHRSFRFEYMTFAEALIVEAVMRQNRGASNVFPRGRPFAKDLPHPSAIALITEPAPEHILVDSVRRIPDGLRIKGGFSRLRQYYAEMIEGMQKAHKGHSLKVEFWSFQEDGRHDIAEKLGKQFEIPFRYIGPAEIRAELALLKSKASSENLEEDNLDGLLALLAQMA